MKNNFSSLIALFLGILMLTSCLKSKDDEVTYYYDTAITSFSVGTLKRYLHTISSTGQDSVYQATINCSTYKFNIDQYNCVIYNPDSLPMGVDASKVLTTITTLNSGVVLVNLKTKDKTKDSLIYYSSADSLDFTEPLEMRVYNNAGTAYRSYRVSVNVHQENGSVFNWTQVAENDQLVASMKGMRALVYDGKLWLMSNDGSGSRLYVSDMGNALSWKQVSQDVYAADAYKSFALCLGLPMFVSNGNIYQFVKNGDQYESQTIAEPNVTKLLGGTKKQFFGYSLDGKLMACEAFGNSWKDDAFDDSAEWLPTEDVNLVALLSKNNSQDTKLILVGNRNSTKYPADENAVVWSKVEENAEYSVQMPWAFYSKSESFKHLLPRLNNLQVVRYGNSMLAIGGDAINGNAKAFSQFYKSEDEGITWQNDTIYKFPKTFNSSNSVFTMTCDENHFLWILAGESGQVWKGRLNEMGWKKEQGAFEN